MKNYIKITNLGAIFWYNAKDEIHRDNDKPAIVWSNGDQYWYQNGKPHRDNDKPAIIYTNGDQEWYQNGKCLISKVVVK